jgi:hypothetical protein
MPTLSASSSVLAMLTPFSFNMFTSEVVTKCKFKLHNSKTERTKQHDQIVSQFRQKGRNSTSFAFSRTCWGVADVDTSVGHHGRRWSWLKLLSSIWHLLCLRRPVWHWFRSSPRRHRFANDCCRYHRSEGTLGAHSRKGTDSLHDVVAPPLSFHHGGDRIGRRSCWHALESHDGDLAMRLEGAVAWRLAAGERQDAGPNHPFHQQPWVMGEQEIRQGFCAPNFQHFQKLLPGQNVFTGYTWAVFSQKPESNCYFFRPKVMWIC